MCVSVLYPGAKFAGCSFPSATGPKLLLPIFVFNLTFKLAVAKRNPIIFLIFSDKSVIRKYLKEK